MMTGRRRSDNEEDYFSDPVKLVHTAEDRTFITDERFIDAEIIDLGDILSPDDDVDYNPPQKDKALISTPVCCENRFFNPSVDLVDFCKRELKNKSPTRISDTKKLETRPIKVKHQVQKSDDTQSDSEIEIIDKIDSNKTKHKKAKPYKQNSKCPIYEKEIEKAIAERNLVKIVDIKKNTGLIGMKIKRSNVDLKKGSGKENTSNKKETNNKHNVEKVSKNSNIIHKVKTKTKSKKKEEKLTFKDKLKKCVTERTKKRKHTKEDYSENFDTEKQIVNDVNNSPNSKSSLSPQKTCKDVEKSLSKNVCKNDMKTKEELQKVKYNANCSEKIITQKNLKVNDIDYDIKQSNGMKIIVGRSYPNMNNFDKHISFPKLNKFTKNVHNKIQKLKKYKIPPTNPVKINKEEKLITLNVNLENMKGNNLLPGQEGFQKHKDLQSDETKRSDTNLKDNDGRKNMKIDLVPKLSHSPKQNKNMIFEVSPVNSGKIQRADYSVSTVAQRIEMNTKEDYVVKSLYPMPSISNNMPFIALGTNVQLEHNNISNINNTSTKETQHEKRTVQTLGRIEEINNQKQLNPLVLHSLGFANAKPPCSTNETIVKKVNYVNQSFSDARMMKIPSYNMNMYQTLPPPPNALSQYQCYPMTMPTISDNYHGSCVGSHILPYGTEIFPYPPPPPPLPSSSLLSAIPPAAEQPLQQTFPYTNQLSTQNSIIGRNSSGIIKKINISAPPPTRPDAYNTEVNSKEAIDKANNTLEYCQKDPNNVKKVVTTTSTVKISGKFKELDTVIQPNVTVFTYIPKTNSKRPLASHSPIRDTVKTNKPCPLSKKFKISDPRNLTNYGQINKKEPMKKGYSPPILPIPTFESMLSQTQYAYYKDTIPNTIVEKPANKNKVFPQRRNNHTEVRKISLEEYKKKNSVLSDKAKENSYRKFTA